MGEFTPRAREVMRMLAKVVKIALLAVVLASSSGCIIHHYDDDDHRGGWDGHRDHDDGDRGRHRKGHR